MSNKNNLEKIMDTGTIIKSPTSQFVIDHYFMPALAVEIGLREGVPLNTDLVRLVESSLKYQELNGLWRWDEYRLIDYDSTLVARNVLLLLGEKRKSEIPLSVTENGGAYTYFGGLKAKSNNSVDLVINSRLFDAISNLGMQTDNDKQIKDYINSRKNDFFQPINNLSKYYVSEGFLLYSLSKIARQIGIEIDEVVEYKIDKLSGNSDVAFALLASPENKKLQELYSASQDSKTSSDLFLFQQPSTNYKFRSPILEQVINSAAKLIGRKNFDGVTAKVYTKKGENLYSYEQNAKSLHALMNQLDISTNDQLTELAIGTGNLLQFMAEKYSNILGVEISLDMIKYAKDKLGNKAQIQLSDANDFSNPSKAIYCANFIDLYSSGDVELWSNNIDEASQLLKNISENINEGGFFFLHKKEDKRTEGYKLRQWKNTAGYNLTQTYLFQDSNITLRRTYNKTAIPFLEFSSRLESLGLKMVTENDDWIAYQK